jgi:hypothetical protein
MAPSVGLMSCSVDVAVFLSSSVTGRREDSRNNKDREEE